MKATLVEEGNDFVLYGELSDAMGYSPDAELLRSRSRDVVVLWANENGYVIDGVAVCQ